MVTAAKGAEGFYNYTPEENASSDSEKENEGNKVRRESPEFVRVS
jgi:hypothetical protein